MVSINRNYQECEQLSGLGVKVDPVERFHDNSPDVFGALVEIVGHDDEGQDGFHRDVLVLKLLKSLCKLCFFFVIKPLSYYVTMKPAK